MDAYGICICGLNGSGKTTLARALAAEIGYRHMDIEDYYFPPSDKPFSVSRTREDVELLLAGDIRRYPRFVFSAVSGSMPPAISASYRCVVYLDVPAEIRMARIRQRAADRFGSRVLPGGDLYEQEENFFAFAASRTPDRIESWLRTLSCPVLRLDGTRPVPENVRAVTDSLFPSGI